MKYRKKCHQQIEYNKILKRLDMYTRRLHANISKDKKIYNTESDINLCNKKIARINKLLRIPN